MTAAFDERANQMPTRDELISEAATAAAQRVDAEAVGLDPITIFTIFTQVLPLLISCAKRNVEPSAEDIQNAVRKQCSTPFGRSSLRRKTMRRIRAESDSPISKEQAFALADAVIDEAINQNPQMVSAVCSVVSDVEFGS